MWFGAHVSIAGGIDKAPENSAKIGGECFQIFSRSPRGGKAKPLTPKLVARFKRNRRLFKQKAVFIHTPYYINLASENNRIKYGSISAIRKELERASVLGAKYVMTHLGAAGRLTEKEAIKVVARSLVKILDGYQGKTELLIEMSAGAGKIIGDEFSEIAQLLKLVEMENGFQPGICFDTAHVFASGYDLRTKEAVAKTLSDFNNIIGLDRLKLIHANDSLVELGSQKDRHAHLGYGKIGLKGFQALIEDPRLSDRDMILETPGKGPGTRIEDIQILKKLRREARKNAKIKK